MKLWCNEAVTSASSWNALWWLLFKSTIKSGSVRHLCAGVALVRDEEQGLLKTKMCRATINCQWRADFNQFYFVESMFGLIQWCQWFTAHCSTTNHGVHETSFSCRILNAFILLVKEHHSPHTEMLAYTKNCFLTLIALAKAFPWLL